MVVKCNDTEASVLLGDTTWTPPFRLGERYLPTRYAAGGEIEAVVERLEKSGVPRLSIRRLQPNPWLYCPVSDNDTVVAEVVGHCGEKAAVEYAGYAGLIEGLARDWVRRSFRATGWPSVAKPSTGSRDAFASRS